MDGVGNEVSHKIRAAIKAKLIELGAYVDDELPDYIMVMVANKRSKVQMEDDLSLFLNNNTQVFTSWLHTVLQKLQEVTVAAKDKKEAESKKVPVTNRAASRDSALKVSHSPDEKVKAKKKHSKKSKEKKQKKSKHKSKDSKVKKSREMSDWEDEDVIPKKKVKKEKAELLDVTKEVGRAIIGSLKERHKSDEKINEDKMEVPAQAVPFEEAACMIQSDVVIGTVECNIANLETLTVPVDKSEDAKENENEESDGFSIIEVKLNSGNKVETVEPTVMAPTRELLKEHDKLTLEGGEKEEKRPASQASSEASVSPEELRKQLLLSRAKRKLEERNLERRMRSNSPEVIIVEETTTLNEQSKPAEAAAAVEAAPAVVAAPQEARSPSPSDRLSLSPSSLASSPVSSHRRNSTSGRHRDKRSKVVVNSRIVAPPEPEEPGLSSVVHVKPREFAPAEKQANKHLILKAVAAAERSVAHAPARKEKEPSPHRPKALFTRDLREKRYENFAVTLPNVVDSQTNEIRRSKKDPQQRDLDQQNEDKCSERKSGEEEHFISSKTTAKDRNESFIKCWLEEVEEAGKHDALIKPDEIDATASGDDEGVEECTAGKETNGAEGRIEALKDGPQIVVTVDGLRSSRGAPPRLPLDHRIKPLEDVNRISNRFARISQPAEEHEFKEKYREFERVRIEKKISREGESKNKRLIAELSMKFGQVNRVFDDEEETVRKRFGDERRGEEWVRKREAGRSGDAESASREKRDRKSSVRTDYDDVRMKSKERCRFWPDCVRASSCEFHHPSSICKLLPNCKFRDKCLYIHPLCKNDRDCSLKDCSYEHSTSRKRKSDPPRDAVKGLCKYDSHCKNLECPYQHSRRSCRYGSRCRNRDCPYFHSHKTPVC